MRSTSRLSAARLGAFASLEIPMAAFLTPLVVYIPPFYAGELGLGLSAVGIVFGLTKIWDIVTDPILGSVIERAGPDRGRWRYWLLISLPLMLIGVYKIFLPPAEVDWIYFAVWMLFLYVGWTLLTISHVSWGIELADDYHERARVAAFRQAAALIGGLIVVFIPVISDQIGGVNEPDRIRFVGLFVLLLLPVLMLLTITVTPVGVSRIAVSDTHRWHDALTILVGDRRLRAVLLGNIGALMGLAATSSIVLFYVESVLRLDEWASLAVVPLLFSGLLFLPAFRYIARRIGKHRAFSWVLIFQIAIQPIFLIIPPENIQITVVCFLLLGAINGCVVFLPHSMIADLKDRETAVGHSRTGSYVALLQSASKVSAALAVALMYLALPITGFDPDPDAANTPESLQHLRYFIVGLPMLSYAIGLCGMRNFDYEETSFADTGASHSASN